MTVDVRDTTAPTLSLPSIGTEATGPDGAIVTLTANCPVYVEASDAVGITTLRINGVAANLESGTPQSGTWTADVPVDRLVMAASMLAGVPRQRVVGTAVEAAPP